MKSFFLISRRIPVNQFKDVNERMAQSAFKAQFMSSLISPFVSLITYLTIGGVAVLGCVFVIGGSITVGNLQAFIRYIWQINDPLSQVSQLSAQVQSAISAMNRIFSLLDAQEEVSEGSVNVDVNKIEGQVSFEHVQFGYDEQLLMHDVSFQVKPGQMVAIVGPTGAGKTTLMNLLLRFYDVKGGAIKIDGIDIRDMEPGRSEKPVLPCPSGYMAFFWKYIRKYPVRPSDSPQRRSGRCSQNGQCSSLYPNFKSWL